MPRSENPAEAAKQERQARYRQRLRALGRPEASEVDVALAAAAAAFADVANSIPKGQGDQRSVLRAQLRGAVDILVARGRDQQQAVAMVRWQVSRPTRKNVHRLVEASRMAKRLGVMTESPRYFPKQNRNFANPPGGDRLEAALDALPLVAGVDPDRASRANGLGFSRSDCRLGQSLATANASSPRDTPRASAAVRLAAAVRGNCQPLFAWSLALGISPTSSSDSMNPLPTAGVDAAIAGCRQIIAMVEVMRGAPRARRREAIVSNRTTTNDNDPFVGAFEKLAGTEKRGPYGEHFGNRSHIQRSCKDSSPRD